MITRVYGHANGQEISFTQESGGIWKAYVPVNLEGEWIVDLYAEKDNGLTAYVCKVLFAITGHKMTMTVIERGFAGDAEVDNCLTGLKGGFTVEYKICS